MSHAAAEDVNPLARLLALQAGSMVPSALQVKPADEPKGGAGCSRGRGGQGVKDAGGLQDASMALGRTVLYWVFWASIP